MNRQAQPYNTATWWPSYVSSAGTDEKAARAAHDALASRRLWCQVIQEAVEDFLSVHKGIRIRESARRWLFDPGEDDDFREVCRLAGIDPEIIREGVRQAAQERELSCDLPNITKPKCSNKPKTDPREQRQEGDAMKKSNEELKKEKIKECLEQGYSIRETSRTVGGAMDTVKKVLTELEVAKGEKLKCTCGLALTHNGRCADRRRRYNAPKNIVKQYRPAGKDTAPAAVKVGIKSLDEEIEKIEDDLASLKKAREIILGRQ